MDNTTVRDLMAVFSPRPLDTDSNVSLSRKQWTDVFPDFDPGYTTYWKPEIPDINEFLGSAHSGAEFVGFETPAYRLNNLPQLISSEGDVTRDFDQNIIPAVAKAFSGNSAMSRLPGFEHPLPGAPGLWPRSLVGSTSSTSEVKTVDYQMTMFHKERYLEMPAMIGEMKKPRVIRRKEWLGKEEVSGLTTRLQKELRGYAHEYRCPQVFVFDMRALVIVQFRASRAEDILREDCPIDLCLIPREFNPHIPFQCTMQYALYRLTSQGWLRLCATLDRKSQMVGRSVEVVRAPTTLSLYEFTREYEYWSGRPIWVDSLNRVYLSHPHGYRREFVVRQQQRHNNIIETLGFFVWKLGNQEIIDDTLNCFISYY